MRRKAKKDDNHQAIEHALRQCGWSTIDTSWSAGKLLDLIAYNPVSGDLWFVEIKGRYGKLSEAERDFFQRHPERSVVIRDITEAMALRNRMVKDNTTGDN